MTARTMSVVGLSILVSLGGLLLAAKVREYSLNPFVFNVSVEPAQTGLAPVARAQTLGAMQGRGNPSRRSPAPEVDHTPVIGELLSADESVEEMAAKALLALPPNKSRTVYSEHDEYVAILTQSGLSSEEWTDNARAILAELQGISDATVRKIECFRAAYAAELSFAEDSRADSAVDVVLRRLSRWPGNHILTGERHERGMLMRTAFLVRPIERRAGDI